MPTENRSSNTEMVLVPRELTPEMRQAYEAHSLAPVGSISKTGYLAMLDAAPSRHQGKPVALPNRIPVATTPGAYTQRGHDIGWNACLDEIAKLGPLFTHADPGEVERLRKDAVTQKAVADEAWAEVEKCRNNSKTITQQVDTLRAQLAELDALLPTLDQGQKDALYSFYLSICCGDQHSVDKPLIRQLCEFGALESVGFGKHRLTKFGEFLLGRMSAAALSASAEPSAPLCTPETPCVWPDSCGHCSKEPSAPVGRDERADCENCDDTGLGPCTVCAALERKP